MIAAAHVQELIDGFWPIHALTALAKLELPEALFSGPAGLRPARIVGRAWALSVVEVRAASQSPNRSGTPSGPDAEL